MSRLDLDIPYQVLDAINEITSLPYYQIGTTYKVATHLLEDDYTPTAMQQLSDSSNQDSKWLKILNGTIEKLQELTISKVDLDRWMIYQSLSGSIITHRQIMDNLMADLTLLAFDQVSGGGELLRSHNNTLLTIGSEDYLIEKGDIIDEDNQRPTDIVLNRNNPFADVSIRDQQFIYAADYNRFNSLELNTSHTLARTQKTEDESFIALYPGFKIKNSQKIDGNTHSLTKSDLSEISFDDTLTTQIAQRDEHTYVYLDMSDIIGD